ncbi:MAG: M14 family metallopeptidase [Blastocatellia bacterium]|nr:M14 family metallopeptidase [Blastocatellia bacterium]MCS7157196.1 M14 family metallopeptidase [Blastocatellia bacterium]MCX7752341.1 M14 family metallopeptidase [Blastocatellia bacterium]MDW8167222.1 M14 family metallopeptidase [Acidobacteriota bacterium]
MLRRARHLQKGLAIVMMTATIWAGQRTVPSPREYLGFDIGEDRRLASWPQIVEYFRRLDEASDRMSVVELGRSTEGRPFIMAIISAPSTLARLEEYRQIQKRLADPRGLSESDARALIERGKVVVLITCNIHSTEVASAQTAVEFAWRMVTEDSPRVREILENVILLLIPSLNPDGNQMVYEWYQRTLGTPYEGTSPPWLYHKYVGHDNNRDWYMFTQVETRLTVEKAHNAWHPQIVYDVHQMGALEARIFTPPWIDPIEPNIDPILVQGMNWLGMKMAADLTAEGKKGVVVNAIYDLWTPARCYQCYHGGLRILTESASVRIASPIEIPFERLRGGRGYDAQRPSWNFPEPWPGGIWRLRDIVDYQLSAFFSLLQTAARHRDHFLWNFYRVGKRAVERKEPPFAFIIPPEQRDPAAARKLIEVLRFGLVEVWRARAAFEADGRTFPAGSLIIPLAQPYGAFAKALLERQRYPDLREYPGGPPKRPYDVTAHTLPLLMGVNVVEITRPFSVPWEPVDRVEEPGGQIVGGKSPHGYVIRPEGHREIAALFDLLKRGGRVYRLVDAAAFPPGTAFIPAGQEALLEETARRFSISVQAVRERPRGAVLELRMPRVGLYRSYVPSMDEGWTRWVFDQFGIPYENVYDRDIRAGDLRRRFDAIILPDQPLRTILEGHRPGTMPEEYTGGIGEIGVANLRRFAEDGGSVIAFNQASEVILRGMQPQVRDVLAGVSEREFYGPGSILKAEFDPAHPVAFGMERETGIWFEEGPAFEVSGSAIVIARYPAGDPLLSGWLLGGERLSGKAALVEVPIGRGRAILFGFRPQYRGQSYATFKTLFNAVLYAASERATW